MVDTLKRTFQKFLADEMPDHAAALTYFAMLSLFPALLVTATLLGLLGDQTLVTKAVDYARSNGAPSEVVDALRSSLQGVVDAAGGALSAALVFSLAIALYGAAGVFGGAGRALNKVHAVKETRPFFRHKAWDLGWTLVAIVLAIIALVSVFLGGGIAGDLFGTIGLGDTAAAIWRIARWFVAIAAVLGMYAITYAFAPNVNPRRVRILTPGALVAVLIWILASVGFFFYVSNFGKYGATYGAFAGAVVLLLWLYISNLAFLFGAELNATVDMRRDIGRGGPPAPSPPPSREAPAPPEGAGMAPR
jgi:membrane protein